MKRIWRFVIGIKVDISDDEFYNLPFTADVEGITTLHIDKFIFGKMLEITSYYSDLPELYGNVEIDKDIQDFCKENNLELKEPEWHIIVTMY